jgi:hypothetical protein
VPHFLYFKIPPAWCGASAHIFGLRMAHLGLTVLNAFDLQIALILVVFRFPFELCVPIGNARSSGTWCELIQLPIAYSLTVNTKYN